jgi:hypothetical protein
MRDVLAHLLNYLSAWFRKPATGLADIPDDLRSDLGLNENLPCRRCDAFWQARRGSNMRDLPL